MSRQCSSDVQWMRRIGVVEPNLGCPSARSQTRQVAAQGVCLTRLEVPARTIVITSRKVKDDANC